MSTACALTVAVWASSVRATDTSIDIGAGLRIDRAVTSMKGFRDEGLVRQQLDYSCGAAALATLLHHGFGEAVTERELLTQLFGLLSAEERSLSRSAGFSLLDLQNLAQARGYRAQAFRLQPGHLAALAGPVIVYIEPRGYRHFAVLRGVRDGRVYLADPARGNIRMPAYTFLESWLLDGATGIILVVEPENGLAGRETSLQAIRGLPRPELITVRERLAIGAPRPGRTIGILK